MKQSSIEWLAWRFAVTNIEEFQDNFNDIIKQAKQMHKQEIIKATKHGNSFEQGDLICENYYEKTYEKE